MADETVTIYAYDDQLNWIGQRKGDGTNLQQGESLLPYIVVYVFDAGSKEFLTTKVVRNDYNPLGNETTVAPTPGLYTPIIWNGNAWIGTDEKTWQSQQEAERQADQKANPVAPSSEQQMINALGLQVASLQTTVAKLTAKDGGAA